VPCFNAAFTTAIGFGSLVLMPIPAIRDFGLFTAVGVMLSYVFSMVLAPLLLDTLPDPPPRRAAAFRPGPLERALQKAVRVIARHPVPAAAVSVAVLALAVTGLARIRVETDLIAALRPSSPLYQATRFIDRHLTGVNSLEILVPGVSPDDPEGLRRVESFERVIRTFPGIRKVLGLPDLMARVHRAFHAGDDAWERLPAGPGAADDLADIRELLEKEAPADLARFVSGDGAMLRVATRAAAMDTSASQALFERIRAAAGAAGLEGVMLTGNFVVLSDMSTSLVRNQVQGLVPAFLMILLAMMVQFRSWRLGLLSAVPNGAPVVMVYGLMGWAGIPLSVPTAMIASVAVGMTVDTTIHLMAHFREAFASGIGYEPALEKMIDASGRAVVFATLPVALGFYVGVFGSFLPSVHFAVLTGTALLLGLVAEIVLLPLMLVLFRPLGREAPVLKAGGRETAGPPAAILPAILAGLLLVPSGWVGADGATGGADAAGVAAEDAAPAPAPGKRSAGAAALLLRDQNGRRDGPGLHRGETMLLLFGKPTGLRRMKTWEKRILAKAGDPVRVLRAVDVREVRGTKTEAEIDARLRKDVPPEIAILVDREGELARAFALPDAEVSATVIDPLGEACGTVSGPADEEGVARMTRMLAGVREKGSCP
jgi:preprotein translocase subunit SecF